jgi:hypothetical protein
MHDDVTLPECVAVRARIEQVTLNDPHRVIRMVKAGAMTKGEDRVSEAGEHRQHPPADEPAASRDEDAPGAGHLFQLACNLLTSPTYF